MAALKQEVAATATKYNAVTASLYTLVGWVIIVTIALVVIGIISFRKWRRDYFLDTQSTTASSDRSESQSSAGDFSDLSSSLNVMMETGSLASVPPLDDSGGEDNEGYEADCNAATIQTSLASVSLDIGASGEPSTSKDIAHLDSNPSCSTSMTSPTTEAYVHQAQTSTSSVSCQPAESPSEPPSSSTPTRL